MPQYSSWSAAITDSMQSVWVRLIDFLPHALAALLIFIIGTAFARGVSHFVTKGLQVAKVDDIGDRLGINKTLDHLGLFYSPSEIFGGLIQWALYVVVLLTLADILQLTQVTDFLNSLLLYLPNVIVAIIVIFVGLFVGNTASQAIRNAGKSQRVAYIGFFAGLARWTIVIFSIMAALVQLGIAAALIQTLFTGIVAMMAIAGGLAFGLGGKDHAQKFLSELTKEFSGEDQNRQK